MEEWAPPAVDTSIEMRTKVLGLIARGFNGEPLSEAYNAAASYWQALDRAGIPRSTGRAILDLAKTAREVEVRPWWSEDERKLFKRLWTVGCGFEGFDERGDPLARMLRTSHRDRGAPVGRERCEKAAITEQKGCAPLVGTGAQELRVSPACLCAVRCAPAMRTSSLLLWGGEVRSCAAHPGPTQRSESCGMSGRGARVRSRPRADHGLQRHDPRGHDLYSTSP